MVGLPDAAVREARERVRAAVKNCGAKFPVSRITVNLAPAGQKKAGTVYDLPILVGILVLQHIAHLFQAQQLLVSRYGVREGYLCRRILRNDTDTPRTENSSTFFESNIKTRIW